MKKDYKSIEKRVLRRMLRQWRALLLAIVCSVAVTGVTAAVAWMIELSINAMTTGAVRTFNYVSLAIVGIFLLKWFFTYGQAYYLSLASQRFVAELRHEIFAHLQRLPFSFFNRRRVGAIQSIITNDVPLVQNGIGLLRESLDAPVRLLVFTTMVFYWNWRLALLACVCLPFIALVIQRIGQQIRRITHLTQGSVADITAFIQEILAGIRIVKSFAMEDREIERFAERNLQVLQTTLKGERRRARLRPTLELIGAVSIALVLWFGGHEVALGHMQAGRLFSFLFLLHQIAQAANGIGAINLTRQQVLAAAERIDREVLGVQPEMHESPHAIELPGLQGHIEFRKVSFSYGEEPVLRNVSFVIQPGEVVALVGQSGAGKSTLIDLLLRFYDPQEGQILIDGYDLRQIKLESLRKQIGVVPQQTILFVGSVRENIAYGLPEANEERVEAAARAAHAHEFIERLPEGYDTRVGDRGVRLSGGESQRLAIARALLREPRILILDEATSNLDTVSERMIHQTIEEGKGRRTTLLVAHRFSTVQCADRILVFHRGKLVEDGSPQELLALDGYYARLYKAALVEQTL